MTSGALIQLNAYGASDVFLFGNTKSPYCYNDKDYMYCFFIEYIDGFPTKKDLKNVLELPNIFD